MVGVRCEQCGDHVLIIKEFYTKRLCLDCYIEKIKHVPLNSEEKQSLPEQIKVTPKSNRRCPICGRIIPDESVICCYCGHKFKSYL